MMIWNSQCVSGNSVLLAKDAELNQTHTRPLRRGGENAVRGGVQLVGVGGEVPKPTQIVLVRRVPAVPGHDVEGRMRLGVLIHLAGELGGYFPVIGGECAGVSGGEHGRLVEVHVEAGNWILEVADVGEAVGAQGTQLRQAEVSAEDLEDVARCTGGFGEAGDCHGEADAGRDDGDASGSDTEVAHFGLDVEGAALWDDEKLSVVVDKGFSDHLGVESIVVDGEAFF